MRTKLPLFLLALLLAVGAYALYQRIEFYTKLEDGPWSEAAQRNPFFAAQRYLEMEHIAVRSDAELSPSEDLVGGGTLILDRSTAVKNKDVAERLLQWVARGGHLIVAPGYAFDGDVLLAHLHVKRLWPHSEDNDEDKNTEKNKTENKDGKAQAEKPAPQKNGDDESFGKKLSERMREYNARLKRGDEPAAKTDTGNAQCPAPDPTDLTEVQLPGATAPLRIAFSNYTVLEQPYLTKDGDPPASDVPKPAYHIANKSGAHMIGFDIGKGRVTVLSDMTIWTYKDIGEHDHVLLLDALIDHNASVHFLYGVNAPSLTTLLWRYAPEATLAGGLLLLAWLLYRGRRFGPILDSARSERRASADHWLAAARYQWRHGQAEALLSAARERIEQRAAARLPGYAQWSTADKLAALSALSAIATSDLNTALYAHADASADRFQHRIATLQQLGSQL